MAGPQAQFSVGKNRILVIDDDVISRRLLKEILVKEGYVVAEADNGRDGLDAVAAFNPELIPHAAQRILPISLFFKPR